MASITMTEGATWAIAAFATGGVIARPWRWPEAVWAVMGAVSLVALSLVPWRDALGAVERGSDVYLFLAGMMLLAAALIADVLLPFWRVCRRAGHDDFQVSSGIAVIVPMRPKLHDGVIQIDADSPAHAYDHRLAVHCLDPLVKVLHDVFCDKPYALF